MNWTNLAWIGGGLAGAYFLVPRAYVGIRTVVDDWIERALVLQAAGNKQRMADAKIEVYKAKHLIQHIAADQNRRGGFIRLPDRTIINLDTRAVFGPEGTRYADEEADRIERLEKILAALPDRTGSTEGLLEAPEQEVLQPQLPRQISIHDVLGMQTPSLESLVLGVMLQEDGLVVPIRRSLHQLMHLLAIGITGSGKSTWLLSFLAQIAMCQENVEVILVDVHGSAFNLCSDWSMLRYPIARNNDEAKRVLNEVFVESQRRSELYQEVPLAEDLASYNRYAKEKDLEHLDPWLIVIDEGTLMLGDSSISGSVARTVQGTRQYGLYVFMTGQTGNATVIKSPIRSNFPTRVCYATEKPSMSAALGVIPEGTLDDIPGRGWARLKGRLDPYMIQAPYIRRERFYKMIEHEGPKNQMPKSLSEEGQTWTKEYLQETWASLPKKTKSAMCRALGKATGGQDWGEVDEAGKWAELWT